MQRDSCQGYQYKHRHWDSRHNAVVVCAADICGEWYNVGPRRFLPPQPIAVDRSNVSWVGAADEVRFHPALSSMVAKRPQEGNDSRKIRAQDFIPGGRYEDLPGQPDYAYQVMLASRYSYHGH